MTELRNAAAEAEKPTRNSLRPIWVAVVAFVTGFIAVLTLGCGILVWVVPGTKVNLVFDFEEWGHKTTLAIHRFGLGAILVGAGIWFTVLTRGLWRRRRYGTVLGLITVAVVLAIAIRVAVS